MDHHLHVYEYNVDLYKRSNQRHIARMAESDDDGDDFSLFLVTRKIHTMTLTPDIGPMINESTQY